MPRSHSGQTPEPHPTGYFGCGFIVALLCVPPKSPSVLSYLQQTTQTCFRGSLFLFVSIISFFQLSRACDHRWASEHRSNCKSSFISTFHIPIHLSNLPSNIHKILKYWNSSRTLHLFPHENHAIRLGGANSHSICFTLKCKVFQCKLEAISWWSQQNHIICKKDAMTPLSLPPDILAGPRNFAQKYNDNNQREPFLPNLTYCRNDYQPLKLIGLNRQLWHTVFPILCWHVTGGANSW